MDNAVTEGLWNKMGILLFHVLSESLLSQVPVSEETNKKRRNKKTDVKEPRKQVKKLKAPPNGKLPNCSVFQNQYLASHLDLLSVKA